MAIQSVDFHFSKTFVALLKATTKVMPKADLLLQYEPDGNVHFHIIDNVFAIHATVPKEHASLPYDKFGLLDVSDFVSYCDFVGYPEKGSMVYQKAKNTKGRTVENVLLAGGTAKFRTKVGDITRFQKGKDDFMIHTRETDETSAVARWLITKSQVAAVMKMLGLVKNPSEFLVHLSENAMALHFSSAKQVQSTWDVPRECFTLQGFGDFHQKCPDGLKIFSTQFIRCMNNYGLDFDIDYRGAMGLRGYTGMLKGYAEFPNMPSDASLPKIGFVVMGFEVATKSMNSSYDIVVE
jgi:hypothetical protein